MRPLLASPDATWDISPQMMWSFIEVNAGIVCASLAALKPLFARYIPFLVVSRLRSSPDHRHTPGKEANCSGAEGRSRAGFNTARNASCFQAYELPSRDGLPIQRPGPAAKNDDDDDDDDESQLWSRRHFCLGKTVSLQSSSIPRQRDGDLDMDSLSSLGLADLYPGARPPVSAISAGGYGTHASQSTEGIKVTKETLVLYGS